MLKPCIILNRAASSPIYTHMNRKTENIIILDVNIFLSLRHQMAGKKMFNEKLLQQQTGVGQKFDEREEKLPSWFGK